MEVAVKPKESSGPRRCAYCHGEDGEVEPCPGECGSYRHGECKTADKKCPTFGCIYGVPIDQIKAPPPEIVELAKRMGVPPSELWPPKKEAQPSQSGTVSQMEEDLSALGLLSGGQSQTAFHDLLSHARRVLAQRGVSHRGINADLELAANEARRSAAEPWRSINFPDLSAELRKPLEDVRAELNKVRDEMREPLRQARAEAEKLRREIHVTQVETPHPASSAKVEPVMPRGAIQPWHLLGGIGLLLLSALPFLFNRSALLLIPILVTLGLLSFVFWVFAVWNPKI